MPSIIEGYNYDIFISYRQKDNKHDGWVTKFVENLKGELEATFKEDVSVYFDENPHDRLQETHNVDKSLEGKLKCLIFIPILSQTYCDPNSYAWQNEFLAFLKMAEQDRFGKDIKLRSGNVAGRILPVRIHDLEQEDIKLFEKETGSVLRALDFVFRTSTGVSRPLKANEDHPQDNLNKTFYSDQINKVGHAIKEIILGMKTETVQMVKEKTLHRVPLEEIKKEERKEEKEKSTKIPKRKLLSGITILVVLIFAAVIAYPKIFKRITLERLRASGERISVAVMPFQNMTNDTSWNVWQEGIQDMLIASLSNSQEELKVRQAESINDLIQNKGLTNYASITPSLASTISQKLDANVFIYGNIKKAGSTVRVYAQLIDSKTEEVFKSFQIEDSAKEENIFQVIDSLSVVVKNFLIISKLEKEESHDIKNIVQTNSLEAYRYFIYGNNAFFIKRDYPTAVKLYSQVIAIDTNLTFASVMLSLAYLSQGLDQEAQKWCLKVYAKRDQLSMQEKLWANWLHSLYFETPYEQIKYLKQFLEIDDQEPDSYYNLGDAYNELDQYDKAIPEYKKALEIYDRWDSKPLWVLNYTNLGYCYHNTGQYKKEKMLYKKAEKDFPNDPALMYRQAALSLTEGDTVATNEYIKTYISLSKERSSSDASISNNLAIMYDEEGFMKKAEEYYRKALSLQPENPTRLNNLAYFLINKDQNLTEGTELIDKALELSPNSYYMLDTKGWGLYKQGKYQEALELLEKAWNLKPIYDHELYLHLEGVKKAVVSQKNN